MTYGLIIAIGVSGVLLFLARRQTVEWQWRHHERQVREAIEAGDGRDITDAIVFFENATGLTSMATTDDAGIRRAVPSLDVEMRQWDAWYAAHKACLSWDIAEQRLELRKGCGD